MYYLDNAATTQVSLEVFTEMEKYFTGIYGNPSSIHAAGQTAKNHIDEARKKIAKTINCKPTEIIFTASGSEANNLAIKGFVMANKGCGIITSSIEHKSVTESCKNIYKITKINNYYISIGVDYDGFVKIDELERYLKFLKDNRVTPFVSIQMANSEVGTVQKTKKIGHLVHLYGGVFHVDAVQAYGSVNIDVEEMEIDMMSVSGHKIRAPKGVGFLYKKNDIKILPLIHGGSQEWGLRAGTENVPYIMGLSKAAEIACKKDLSKVAEIRDYMMAELRKIPMSKINGAMGRDRLPGNINISFKNVDGEALLLLLDVNGVYVSNGSACNAGTLNSSDVLKAMKISKFYRDGTIRLTIDENISQEDVDVIVGYIRDAVETLRKAKGENYV